MTNPTASAPPEPTTPAGFATTSRAASALQLVRSLCHLLVIVAVAVWGFLSWELPFPGVFTGIGILALAVLLWALFLSPRPVLRTDRFGRSLIELLFLAAGVGAMLALGMPWPLAAVFGVIAAVLGYLAKPQA